MGYEFFSSTSLYFLLKWKYLNFSYEIGLASRPGTTPPQTPPLRTAARAPWPAPRRAEGTGGRGEEASVWRRCVAEDRRERRVVAERSVPCAAQGVAVRTGQGKRQEGDSRGVELHRFGVSGPAPRFHPAANETSLLSILSFYFASCAADTPEPSPLAGPQPGIVRRRPLRPSRRRQTRQPWLPIPCMADAASSAPTCSFTSPQETGCPPSDRTAPSTASARHRNSCASAASSISARVTSMGRRWAAL